MVGKSEIEWLLFLLGGILFSYYAIHSKKVNLSGSISGMFIAGIIFCFIHWEGVLYFLAFFLLGSFASKWKLEKKTALGLAQEKKGKRTHVHAISNTGAGAFYAILLYYYPGPGSALNSIAVAAVFAAATSDTLSSELGNVLGTRYFDIITLKKDDKGKDGIISPEGTAIGLIGSAAIALIHFFYHHSLTYFVIITLCGFIANLADSFLGATLQRQKILNNHSVNLCSTFIAGLLSIIVFITIL